MPISSCTKKFVTLPVHKGGLGIPLLKNVSDQMWLQKRNALKHSSNSDIKQVWSDTSHKHISSDSLLITDNLTTASITLKKSQMSKAKNHFYALEVQGIAARTVSDTVSKSNILLWTSNLESVPSYLRNFAKKALQQQLATLSNLVRWKKASDAFCPLCGTGAAQTNKHVFSNCSSPVALERYTQRHDAILSVIADWIYDSISTTQILFVDITSFKFKPISDLFNNEFRPDIAIVQDSSISVLELTVCHETNMENSKLYKLNKYRDLHKALKISSLACNLKTFSIEVSVLGFVRDVSEFIANTGLPKMPKSLLKNIANLALNYSYNIYRSRSSTTQSFHV